MADFCEPRHPWPVICLSKGNRKGRVYLVTDCGMDEYKLFTIVFDDSGEVWDVPSKECVFQDNWTFERGRERPDEKALDRKSNKQESRQVRSKG